ncbi:MAG: hypothetical protein KKA62_03875 [Nanoarchaeota archaeon]|nr:hypothetical protein [Nanoarchaeota archaeon]MBU1643793.1 hypothetical protein [Nanoarchaeota archaeon]MBU1977064.1 hypothetical protein [Nanoarchaeota archaeon]
MLEKINGKLLTAFIAVLFGVFAVISFVPQTELAIGFLSLSFGIVAVIWTYRAKMSLSSGTSLRDYANYFLLSLLFIISYSVWDTLIFLFNWSGMLVYPKYFLVTIAYLIFVFTAYKILYLGKQFGFKLQVEKMKLNRKMEPDQKKKLKNKEI